MRSRNVTAPANKMDLQHPRQGTVQLGVNLRDVVQVDGFVQQHLVERQRKPSVQVVTVKDSQAHDASHEMKV